MREAVNREKGGQLHAIIAANQQPDIHLPGNFASILMCFSITYCCSIIRMQPFSDTFPHKLMWSRRGRSRDDKTRESSERVSINLAPPKVEGRCRRLSSLRPYFWFAASPGNQRVHHFPSSRPPIYDINPRRDVRPL
jgi:hypothetical protein